MTSLDFFKTSWSFRWAWFNSLLAAGEPKPEQRTKTYFNNLSTEPKTEVGAVCTVPFGLLWILKVQQWIFHFAFWCKKVTEYFLVMCHKDLKGNYIALSFCRSSHSNLKRILPCRIRVLQRSWQCTAAGGKALCNWDWSRVHVAPRDKNENCETTKINDHNITVKYQ